MSRLCTAWLTLGLAACVHSPPASEPASGPAMMRICDASGCSDRPRSSATFDANHDADPQATRRAEALAELAAKDPRAAYDLGLRYFRGDGVRQNSHQALQWMRSAGERGHLQAQMALGRFYLMGLEEMGPDPAEAEKWLSMAAGRGNAEARRLLSEASAAKRKNQAAYQDWIDQRRNAWAYDWRRGYVYHWGWHPSGWALRP